MSPIKGYTDLRRLPRIGKIHLGIKQQSQKSTASFPKAVEWFEVHEDSSTSPEAVAAFHEAYGDKPTELHIMFPTDDDMMFADANYKAYSQTHGLICKGTGETAVARWDLERNGVRPEGVECGTWANRETKTWTTLEIPCPAEACPMMKDKRCRAVMNLQFLLPRVPGIGVWQIDTGSWNSIVNVRGNIELLKALTGGHIRGIELLLRRVSKKVTPAGEKAKNVYVLDVYNPLSLPQIMSQAARLQSGAALLLPPADDDMPEDLYPDGYDADGIHETPDGALVDRATGEVVEEPAAPEPAKRSKAKGATAAEGYARDQKRAEAEAATVVGAPAPSESDDDIPADYRQLPDDGDPGPSLDEAPPDNRGAPPDNRGAPSDEPSTPQTYAQQVAVFQREHKLSAADVCNLLGIEYALEPSPMAALTKAVREHMERKDTLDPEVVYKDWMQKLTASKAQPAMFEADAADAAREKVHP